MIIHKIMRNTQIMRKYGGKGMLKIEREQEILNALRGTGHVSVRQLSESLYTSESTVRRILTNLEGRGLIRRTYGGAELLENHTHAPSFSARARQNISAKREIALKAATLVTDGSIVFLDQSTTSYYLADVLKKKKSLTVVTNNIEIAVVLMQTEFEVYVSGGRLSQQMRMCLVGEDAHRIFTEINADFAFFSAKSLSEDGIISDCSREEIYVRNAMLKNANRRVFLCDSTKFGGQSGYRQCSLSDVDILVSEGDNAQRFADHCESLTVL